MKKNVIYFLSFLMIFNLIGVTSVNAHTDQIILDDPIEGVPEEPNKYDASDVDLSDGEIIHVFEFYEQPTELGDSKIQARGLPLLLPVGVTIVKVGLKLYIKKGTKQTIIRNGHLAGKYHPVTNVRFTNYGFPMFEVNYSHRLSFSLAKATNAKQFAEADKALIASYKKGTLNLSKFSNDQKTDLKNGKRPRDMTWHHSEQAGILDLVDTKKHNKTGHTGGNAIWGK